VRKPFALNSGRQLSVGRAIQEFLLAAWCGSVDAIPIYDLAVHVMSESFKWERVEG
jgi:hypothetical protein